jgi:hypothetical protein
MPKLPIINSLRQRWKGSIPSYVLKNSSVINLREGEAVILTYTSGVEKMKVFSAFIREGLENGDLVDYTYPDEESGTVRARLKEYGIDVEKHEGNGSLDLDSLTEFFLPDGKFDKERVVRDGLVLGERGTNIIETSKTLEIFLLLMGNGRNSLETFGWILDGTIQMSRSG